MKVISLLQPWATLVVMGAKKFETRSWNTKHRGPILIHASKPKTEAARLCNVPGTEPFKKHIRHYKDLPYGAIIGGVNIERTEPTLEVVHLFENYAGPLTDPYGSGVRSWKQEKAFGDYSPRRWAWLLTNPIIFNDIIPAKGALSIWEFPDEKLIEHGVYIPG